MGYRTFGTSGLYVPGLFLAAMTFGELHVALEPVTTARYADTPAGGEPSHHLPETAFDRFGSLRELPSGAHCG